MYVPSELTSQDFLVDAGLPGFRCAEFFSWKSGKSQNSAGIATTAQKFQSKPFKLVITQATEKALDGEQLSACHTGAAIQSLCLAGSSGGPFYLNHTKGREAPIKGDSLPGSLIWNLLYSGNLVESEPMTFYSNPSTNVVMVMFEHSYNQQEVFFTGKILWVSTAA
ncbi:hypothetical protein N7451_012141 [Penicillium sp. IBT 35674x]|nr:hypothetical protein N7451_012141 [Penicillium sp. IBT 35674x]